MNLIEGVPWLPVRRASGVRETILPWQITERIDENPIVALDLPRPDFNGSLVQFLIGLFQTAWAPEDEAEWTEAYERPPAPEVLREACLRYREAFNVDGDGPRFLQDLEEMPEGARKEIASLLIDEPGEEAKKRNRDLWIKRGLYPVMGFPTAVAALFTLQTNAPAGGRGMLTSVRGGGPLTTLLIPAERREVTLWHMVWLNVLCQEGLQALTGNHRLTEASAIFPWMAPTRTGVDTTPMDAHPLQMYWGMPRRIRLDVDSARTGTCALTEQEGVVVESYRSRPNGVNYVGAWQHPLTPYRIEPGQVPIRVGTPSGGIGYRHWLAFALSGDESITPATVVSQSHQSSHRRKRKSRIWAFGYEMEPGQAKVIAWSESIMPVYYLTADQQDRFVADVKRMVLSAHEIANNLRYALKRAWFSDGATVREDKLNFIVEAFWHETQPDFYAALDVLHRSVTEDCAEPDRRAWLRRLNGCALTLFDTSAASGSIENENPKRIAIARKGLEWSNHSKKIMSGLGLEAKAAAIKE